MKKLSFLFALLCLSSLALAQKPVSIHYTTDHSVLLNDQPVDNSTELSMLQEQLGKAVLYKEFPNGKALYHFPEAGMAAHLVNGKLLFLGVNLNWDGDEKFPEQTFTGSLKIGDTVIDASSTSETLSGIEGVELFCPVPIMCMTKDRNLSTPIMASFKDEKISQLGVEFH